MLFEKSFEEFDFEEFYAFLRVLIERHGFRNVLFTPDNIFLREGMRTPAVGDFGLCLMLDDEKQLTEASEAVGARNYMAPELEDGHIPDVTTAADVYSLGKLLYWMLAGRVFSREKHRQDPFDLAQRQPDDPYLAFVYEILDRTIVLHPEERAYSNGIDLADAVDTTLRKLQAGVNPVGIDVPQRCIYCGEGKYRPQYASPHFSH